MNILRGAVACVGAALAMPNSAPAQPIGVECWNQFRGAHGDGKAGQARLPAAFGEAKNVRWKTAIHDEGWGWNSACRPICENGLVYLTTGFAKQLLAIRPDGNGDVTDTHVVWKARKGVPSISSPVTANGLLFMVEDKGGFVSSLDACTGREIWRARLGYGRDHWASPLCVGSSIYFLSRQGDVTAIAAEPEFRILANHKFEGTFVAGPAVAGNALIVRSESHLYRISDD